MERTLFGYLIKCVNSATGATQYGKTFAVDQDHFNEDGQPIDALAAAELAILIGQEGARLVGAPKYIWSLVTVYA